MCSNKYYYLLKKKKKRKRKKEFIIMWGKVWQGSSMLGTKKIIKVAWFYAIWMDTNVSGL